MELALALWNRITGFGIKQKILLVLVGVLVLTTLLDALLASYFTNRQNKESAFANLDNQLVAWQSDLQTVTTQLRVVAVATVGDTALLNQLSELLTLEFNLDDPARASGFHEMTRTLAYRKTVSLNRLQLALRTGGFTSITVYTRGKLSYHISGSEVGMMVGNERNRNVWVKATANAAGDMPFHSWPAWERGALPKIAPLHPDLRQPTVSFSFPEPQETMLEVAVPVQGIVENVMTDAENVPIVRFFSELSVAGLPVPQRPDVGPASKHSTLAVVVFRKSIGRAALEEVARSSGSVPTLFSPDGRHRQELTEPGLIPAGLLQQLQEDRQAHRSSKVSVVSAGDKSYYVALLPWEFEDRPRLILALASPRDGTVQNIQQTVAAILTMAVGILFLSIAVGTLWVKRLIDPIVHLTSAVEKITRKTHLDAQGRRDAGEAWTTLQPIHIDAQDEVGALARAFNAMVAELQQSFETLEQRVHDRTEELRQQTRYMQSLFDTLPLMVWMKDTHGRYLAANQASAAACGHSVDDMIGKSDADLWPSDQAALFHADETEVRVSLQRKIVEREQVFADVPTPVWMETCYVPVLDEDGTLLGTVGVARNISELKATEAAREAALAEAERLMQLRSDFLAQMSHELRTPLNGILGYAQILLREKSLSESQATGLNVIQKSGEHLLTLINDVLDLAKIDANKMELYTEDITFEKFLQVLNEIVGIKATQKNLAFFCETAPDLPQTIHADGQRLRQVLLNLLANAIKFTDHGRVVFRISHTATGRLRFEVEDTGRGIEPDQLKSIFLPFEQAGKAKQRMGGTGLGLAISQKLVGLMGGEIKVESRYGEGSRFSFDIEVPEKGMLSVAAPSERPITGYAGERKTILVVDDLVENRRVICDMLTPLGFSMIEGENGLQALAQVEKAHPDIILMDVAMPEMDGLEATRHIRESRTARDIPVIAISANVSSSDETSCLAAGMSAFLPKPVAIDKLLLLIASLLQIEWTYEPAAAPESPPGKNNLIIPPQEEMEILHRLALMGDMREIQKHSAHLVALDERYRLFSDQLSQLAQQYQSKAILRFVEQYLEKHLGT